MLAGRRPFDGHSGSVAVVSIRRLFRHASIRQAQSETTRQRPKHPGNNAALGSGHG